MSNERKAAVSVGLLLLALLVGLNAQTLYSWIPETGHSKQQRAEAEWYRYRAEHGCRITNTRQRSQTSTRLAGKFPVMTSELITEYEWTCKGGDVHWTR